MNTKVNTIFLTRKFEYKNFFNYHLIMLYSFTTFVSMKNYIIALAFLAMGLASCGSGSTESSANTVDSTVVTTDTTKAVIDTVKAAVVDTTVKK